MRKALFSAAFVCLVLSVIVTPVWAKGWYIGGGVEMVSFDGDLDFIDTGAGFGISFGYKFNPLLAVDVLWGGTIHNEYLSWGLAAQGNFLVGAKFSFNDPEKFQPYLTVGLANHAVDFDYAEQIDGSGTYLGFGADIYFHKNHALNISFRNSSWTGEDSLNEYDVTNGIFSVAYNYHFLQ